MRPAVSGMMADLLCRHPGRERGVVSTVIVPSGATWALASSSLASGLRSKRSLTGCPMFCLQPR